MIARPVLSTIEVNAIGAALNERIARLGTNLVDLQAMPESASRDEAIEFTEMGIRHAIAAMTAIDLSFSEEESARPVFESDPSARWHEYLDR